ncbi:MAG TPA: NAD(P)/FAD-dependent oxidoreductase [Steroidobacteraceae bacterium]|nr:NAD(P)/FAD-dependent oxidoreductase [Steroidobacteraceae bacterium]
MKSWDVVVVGGGPAGSSAAWELKRSGADVLVIDKERFPRLKLCAGWITPEVVRDLELDVSAYPHRFLTFERMHAYIKGLHVRLNCIQHSIRRFEFDAWLLERSGAQVLQHNVRNIRRENGGYVIDDEIRCRYLIGAGGTRCPVYRTFFREANPRAVELQTVTLEHEFPYDWQDADCHLWFFQDGLPGYSWYVPKANGWLNVGVGGMAERIKRSGRDIRSHWARLLRTLDRRLMRGADPDPSGYSYYLRGKVEVPRVEDAFVTGDAAGLATRDMCEGIGPAVRSGVRAARAILGHEDYSLEDVTGASLGGGLTSRVLDWAFTRGAGRSHAVLGLQ